MWQPGSVIVQEEYWRHKLVTVRPVIVVEDSRSLLALYAPVGAPFRFGPWGAPSRQQLTLEERLRVYLSDEPPELDDGTTRSHVLTLNPPGVRHSFKLFWNRDWNFTNWYVNLEASFQRLPHGIIHRDLFLDLVVAPDLMWSWKDEDEFQAICSAGALPEDECRRVREEAARVVARIERRGWPFDTAWPAWRPDPAWPAPSIPGGWRPHGPPATRRTDPITGAAVPVADSRSPARPRRTSDRT